MEVSCKRIAAHIAARLAIMGNFTSKAACTADTAEKALFAKEKPHGLSVSWMQ